MKLYLASNNAHKVAEMSALAAESMLPIEILSANAVGGMPPVVEDTGSFIGNARKKALALKAILPQGAWVLADDSGLCVNALGGSPGVESAYYAGPVSDGAANLKKLVDVMRAVQGDQRSAYFVCVLLAITPSGDEWICEAQCSGTLRYTPKGGNGFGYDSLFVPDGQDHTFAEMDDETKNKFSHRRLAWLKFELNLKATKSYITT